MQSAVQAPPPAAVAYVAAARARAGRTLGGPQQQQAEQQPKGWGCQQPALSASRRRSCAAHAAEGTLLGGLTAPAARQLRIPVGDREIILETGEVGRQANGAVMATDGETMLYTTACAVDDNSGDGSFAPLQVHYAERFSAAGRTSGGYLKRDGRPKDHEVLVSRLIDRPIRPMIQSGWTHSTQVLTWVMSYDGVHSTEPLAITAAGAALAISDIPLRQAVAGARVGLLPGRGFVVNPTVAEQEASSLDLLIAGTSEAVLMIEGFCDFLTEEQMLEAVHVGQAAVRTMCLAIEGWAAEVGKPKRTDGLLLPPEGLDDRIRQLIGTQIEDAYRSVPGKKERGELIYSLRQQVRDALVQPSMAMQLAAQLLPQQAAAAGGDGADGAGERAQQQQQQGQQQGQQPAAGAQQPAALPSVFAAAADLGAGQRYEYATVQMALKRVESAIMRRLVLEEGFRADGRGVGDVRPIWSRADVLPRTHGSVLFTRGETQAMAVTTLGCSRMAQRVDTMTTDDEGQRFYLQYFFPPSSVGEVGRMGGPGRREVGHGNLAERALLPVVPPESEFPYTIRVESTITESNGSSSMASVCGGCLSMMDAGVPLKRMVAGVAMGLILEKDGRFVVLTDILGSEDSLGDMDFKVAGDEDGITAFQMDIKVEGITLEIMQKALAAAGEGRRHILAEMRKCSPEPRAQLSQYAPRIRTMSVPMEKVGMAIGPGGRTIKHIQESTGCEVQIDGDSGTVTLKGDTQEACDRAVALLEATIADPEPGRIYRGCRVTQVMPFGAFVEVLPKREGLLHVSEWGYARLQSISDVCKDGDLVDVMVTELQDGGKFKLSRKSVLVADGVPAPPPGARGASDGPPGAASEPVEVGKVYRGCRITQIMPFGAFVQVAGRREGLLRVSEWASTYTTSIGAVAKEGDLIDVQVTEIAPDGKFKLSRKAVLLSDAAGDTSAADSDADSESSLAPGTPTAADAAADVAAVVVADDGASKPESGNGGGGNGKKQLRITVR